MSLTQAIPNSSQELSVEHLTEEEYNNLYNFLQVLIDYIKTNEIGLTLDSSDGSGGKLSKLSIRHLMELASDMCDELDRRDMGSVNPLPMKSELTDKRNNARVKMSGFPSARLNSLILEVVQELDKRKIYLPSQKISEENKKKRASDIVDSSKIQESSPLASKKIKCAPLEEKIQQGGSLSPMKRKSFGGGMCTGIDSLDAMIEDLGSLIDNDSNEEIDELKMKYEAEIQNLKQDIAKYESSVIPDKNREITRLMSKNDETELINSRLRKELSLLNEQLSCKESMIQDQKAAYSSLKEALENIENQISRRDSDALSTSRKAARLELVSNNVFSDLKTLSHQILSAIGDLDDCMSNFNQKSFLKSLRDFGASSKSFVVLFDNIIQVASNLNLDNLCEDGEKVKSEYIYALSSILVSGKDFSSRPEFRSNFQSAIDVFKSSLESLANLQGQFECDLKN